MSKEREDKVLFLLVFVVYCLLCFYLPRVYNGLPDELSPQVTAVIPSGVNARDAAEIFVKAGAADDAKALARAMYKSGIDRHILPGLYTLQKSTPSGIVQQLATTKPVVHKVTLIPGSRLGRISSTFGKNSDGVSCLEIALAKNENFQQQIRSWLPEKAEQRMMFLLPETYFTAPGPRMADDFVKRASALWYARVGNKVPPESDAASVMKSGILASVIEGEAKAADERPILAGIFLKRLEKNMKLQSCATVIYAWEEVDVKKHRLTYRDLEIKSPYNTYIVEGLPPGPICVPSEGSWLAALSPKESEYLFFFAGKDGRHIFSKSYNEHLSKQRRMGM